LLNSNFSIADHCILLSGVALYSNITLIFQEIVVGMSITLEISLNLRKILNPSWLLLLLKSD